MKVSNTYSFAENTATQSSNQKQVTFNKSTDSYSVTDRSFHMNDRRVEYI